MSIEWPAGAWCPLFGGFPHLEEPRTTPAMRLITTIMEARGLWGIKQQGIANSHAVYVWPGLTYRMKSGNTIIDDCPEPEIVERLSGYSSLDLRAARSIFDAENILNIAQFSSLTPGLAQYLDGAILTCPPDMDECLNNLLSLARRLPDVDDEISDHAIIAMVAAREAFTALRQLLARGEISDVIAIPKSGTFRGSRPDQNAMVLLMAAIKIQKDMETRAKDAAIHDAKLEIQERDSTIQKKDAILDYLKPCLSVGGNVPSGSERATPPINITGTLNVNLVDGNGNPVSMSADSKTPQETETETDARDKALQAAAKMLGKTLLASGKPATKEWVIVQLLERPEWAGIGDERMKRIIKKTW
ncbi:MAG: hypothetical protein HQL90_09020 [Magnetococcales bacterium]|nr:hypothetical protein [Magnetococcales bacterium]